LPKRRLRGVYSEIGWPTQTPNIKGDLKIDAQRNAICYAEKREKNNSTQRWGKSRGKYMGKYMNDLINIKTKNQRTGFPPVRI
jgi:hypothetical protein